jgi:hypothetical protein
MLAEPDKGKYGLAKPCLGFCLLSKSAMLFLSLEVRGLRACPEFIEG